MYTRLDFHRFSAPSLCTSIVFSTGTHRPCSWNQSFMDFLDILCPYACPLKNTSKGNPGPTFLWPLKVFFGFIIVVSHLRLKSRLWLPGRSGFFFVTVIRNSQVTSECCHPWFRQIMGSGTRKFTGTGPVCCREICSNLRQAQSASTPKVAKNRDQCVFPYGFCSESLWLNGQWRWRVRTQLKLSFRGCWGQQVDVMHHQEIIDRLTSR